MTTRQFVSIRFREGGRLYTYHNDGEPVAVGDRIKIDSREGWQAVTVEGVTDKAPAFETKAILGLVGDGRDAIEGDDDADMFSGEH